MNIQSAYETEMRLLNDEVCSDCQVDVAVDQGLCNGCMEALVSDPTVWSSQYPVLPTNLYAVVCSTFGRKFSFEASSVEAAEALVKKWCRYHGFQFGSDFELVKTTSRLDDQNQ